MHVWRNVYNTNGGTSLRVIARACCFFSVEASIASEKLITRAEAYKPLGNLKLVSAYPIVQGYKDSVAAGMRFDIADRLRLAGVNITAGYSPDTSLPMNERFHFTFDSHLWNWKLSGYYNNADFYDLFGPTKVSRKGYSLQLAHSKYLIYDTSFGKALGEWNSPPMRFRRVGSTWLYANWARLSLFASGLVTNFGNSAGRQEWVDVGAQVDFRVVLFTYLNTTLSGGYAGATDGHGHISTEYMISLKIL